MKMCPPLLGKDKNIPQLKVYSQRNRKEAVKEKKTKAIRGGKE